jgi:hypothetical protein
MSGVDNMNYVNSLNATARGQMRMIAGFDVATDFGFTCSPRPTFWVPSTTTCSLFRFTRCPDRTPWTAADLRVSPPQRERLGESDDAGEQFQAIKPHLTRN